MMGSRDNICIEKLDIQNGLPEDGVLFLNGDNDMIRKHIDYVKNHMNFMVLQMIVHIVQKRSVKRMDKLYLNSTTVI